MKAPEINNVIYQAKAVKPGTPRSVIDRVLTDLIGCVEYLSEELKIKLEQKQRADRNQFGKKSESLKDFEGKDATEEIQGKLKELIREAKKLAPMEKPEPSALKSPGREYRTHKANDIEYRCPLCHSSLVDQGQYRVAEEIDVEESRFINRRHYLHKARCKCGGSRLKAPPPVRGVPGTLYSPRFIARLICDKFRLSLPLYRQYGVMKTEGLNLSRSTLTRLLHRHVDAMEAIIRLFWDHNRREEYLACDESPVRFIGAEKKQAYLYCGLSDKAVTFAISTGRSKKIAEDIFGPNPDRLLQTDCLNIYNNENLSGTHAGCLAHMRRHFFNAIFSFPSESCLILGKIWELYLIEREINGKAPEAKAEIRQQKSLPILEEIYREASGFDPPPRSVLGKAIKYMKKHWEKLTAFVYDGRLRIDNNRTEQQIRLPKLGFKNYLFTRSEKGNSVVATYYTLIATCLLNKLHPEEYLEDVTYRINAGWPNSRIEELLPWNWKPCNREEIERSRLTQAIKFEPV